MRPKKQIAHICLESFIHDTLDYYNVFSVLLLYKEISITGILSLRKYATCALVKRSGFVHSVIVNVEVEGEETRRTKS